VIKFIKPVFSLGFSHCEYWGRKRISGSASMEEDIGLARVLGLKEKE
jgi:hypothetical protein